MKKEMISLKIAVIVVSDTRDERSDKSGKVLESKILKSGHKLFAEELYKFYKEVYDG